VATVHQLQARTAGPTLAEAAAAFCDTLDAWGTRRVYAGTLRALLAELGPAAPVVALSAPATAAAITAWFTDRWGGRAPSTYNRNLDALRSAIGYWGEQEWLSGDPTRSLRRRRRPVDRTRALSRSEIEQLLAREDIPLREKTLWRMLYETAASVAEVLALDVEDLDLRNRRARVRRKDGAVDVVVWQTGTARLLPRLLEGRRSGPLFLTRRRARLPLAAVDVDPASGGARLSYRRAAELFEQQTGGWILHQLRHSALTHAAEAGANTSTLLAYSGHTSVASLARYARVSPEALGKWQAGRDPASRRRARGELKSDE
jgi:integrase/recombinase XerC/integrase/recombinase XerD